MQLVTACVALLCLCTPAFPQGADAPPVKKSEQGICHERGSATYKRTKHFESYDTLEACLASGGRLAKNAGIEGQERSGAGGSSWLGGLGGKVIVIVGMLAVVGGAFFLSRRRNPS